MTAGRAPGPGTGTADGVTAAVASIAASVRAAAQTIESTGRLPDDLIANLRTTGVLDMWLPRELGGAEVPPPEVFDTIEQLARSDGSTGWCTAVSVGTTALAGYLPEEGARQIFSAPATITGGAFIPAGRATVRDGALCVSGQWPFGSGALHADWLCGGCVIVDEGGDPVVTAEGRPDVRLAFFPAADAVIHDTWRVMGMRGTGSHDFEVQALEVPLERTMPMAFSPWPQGALWRMPPMALFFAPMAAVPIGMAQAAIDALVALAADKTPYRSARRLAERDVVQAMVARAEAAVGSARAFLRATVADVWQTVLDGGEATLRQRAQVRLAVVNAASGARDAVNLCLEAAGSTALGSAHPIQRHFRDVHAAGQHVVLAFPGYETVGRVMLGLEPDTPLL